MQIKIRAFAAVKIASLIFFDPSTDGDADAT
jgi:hypothetical protein